MLCFILLATLFQTNSLYRVRPVIFIELWGRALSSQCKNIGPLNAIKNIGPLNAIQIFGPLDTIQNCGPLNSSQKQLTPKKLKIWGGQSPSQEVWLWVYMDKFS